MIKKPVNVLFWLFGFLLFADTVFGQSGDELNGYVKAMVTSQSTRSIKPLIKGTLTLKLPDFHDVVNKTKACVLLDNFLKNNNAKNYRLKKSGEVSDGRFVIASFSAQSKEYIMYILFIKEEKKYFIQQIEIE